LQERLVGVVPPALLEEDLAPDQRDLELPGGAGLFAGVVEQREAFVEATLTAEGFGAQGEQGVANGAGRGGPVLTGQVRGLGSAAREEVGLGEAGERGVTGALGALVEDALEEALGALVAGGVEGLQALGEPGARGLGGCLGGRRRGAARGRSPLSRATTRQRG